MEIQIKGDGYNHGTMIQTGISCKKTSCYIGDSAFRWSIVGKTKTLQENVEA